ncbi:MAG: VOC family protein [Bacteroidetes bacterium]|nr:VOC family protein [Bacteroidota bacterium]
MNKFSYTIFYVQNVEKTLEFYENAFGFTRKFMAPGNEYGELDTGITTLSFASITQANSNLKNGFLQSDPNQKPFAVEIGITTEDVPGAVAKAVNAGASILEEPATKPWGQVVAYVRDPEGFLIEICTPMD